MDVETLRAEMAALPVQWRWEGTSGHPRRIADSFAQALEDEGYTVDVADPPVTQGAVGNVGEFEGAIIARWRQPMGEALRRKWFAAVVGVVLVPVIIGIFILWYALRGRRHTLALDWRGEAYPTTARAGQVNFGAERTGVVSDVRVTLRGAVVDAGKPVQDIAALQPSLGRVQGRLQHALINLTMPAPMAPGAGPDGAAIEGGYRPAPAEVEGAPMPPALESERRTDP